MVLKFEEDEAEAVTAGGTPRSKGLLRVASESDAPAPDEAQLLGQVLAACARNEQATNSLALQVGTLTRELTQHRRDLDESHNARVSAAKHASTTTSNRMAALLGALFVLWETAAPMLHELYKMVHR